MEDFGEFSFAHKDAVKHDIQISLQQRQLVPLEDRVIFSVYVRADVAMSDPVSKRSA
jgi:hypothetical protein